MLICALNWFTTYGQDTSRTLPMVAVESIENPEFRIATVHTASPSYFLSDRTIQELGSRDVGEALKFIPGVQIKDYGGVGGIRTVSYRSLSSSYSGVVLDGNSQLNSQTGSFNLSQFEAFGMKTVRFCTGQPDKLGVMPSAYIPAQTIRITTNLFWPDTSFNFEVFQNAATIHNFQSGLIFNIPIKRLNFGAQLLGTYGSGQYPFKYDLSGSPEKLTRMNSRLANYKGRIGADYHFKKGVLEASIYYNYNDQQLPGAVILYNPSNDQKIRNNDLRGDINLEFFNKSSYIRTNAFIQSNYTLYEDPNYLNFEGFLRSAYQQTNYGLGAISNYIFDKIKGRFVFGSDLYISQLTSNEFSNNPFRAGANSVIAFDWKSPSLLVEANVSHQFIYDQRRSGDSLLTNIYSKFSPYVALRWHPFKKKWTSIRIFYKRVFKMPTFNDLYYNFIGNTNLQPEDAHLFNFGIGHEINLKAGAILEFGIDGFYNLVENKIVAIPTKDIFNWSMQNIGNSRAIGFDFSALYAQKKGDWNWSLNTTFTYNHAVDITNPSSSSYLHQLPYTPLIAGSGMINLGWKGYTISNNVIYTGERFSLNENIPINQLDPFIDWNIGLSKEFDLTKNYRLFVSAKIMNVVGNNYEVVRSFPMPGRHYQFTLKFKYK